MILSFYQIIVNEKKSVVDNEKISMRKQSFFLFQIFLLPNFNLNLKINKELSHYAAG